MIDPDDLEQQGLYDEADEIRLEDRRRDADLTRIWLDEQAEERRKKARKANEEQRKRRARKGP